MPQILPYPYTNETVAVPVNTKIFIKVEPRDQGGVLLVAVNEDGSRSPHSQILSINDEGQLHLKGNLNPDLGFSMSDDGTIEQV